MAKILLVHKCLKFEKLNFVAKEKKLVIPLPKSLKKLVAKLWLEHRSSDSQASGIPRRGGHLPSLLDNCIHPFLTALIWHPSIQQVFPDQQWPGVGWDREVVEELCHSPCHQGAFSLLVKQGTHMKQEWSLYTFDHAAPSVPHYDYLFINHMYLFLH